jgi:hypothetical protein
MVISFPPPLSSVSPTTHIAKSVEVGRSREERGELAGAWEGAAEVVERVLRRMEAAEVSGER